MYKDINNPIICKLIELIPEVPIEIKLKPGSLLVKKVDSPNLVDIYKVGAIDSEYITYCHTFYSKFEDAVKVGSAFKIKICDVTKVFWI